MSFFIKDFLNFYNNIHVHRASQIVVYAGTTNIQQLSSTAQTRTVYNNNNNVIIHSWYNPNTLNNDISVIRLPSPLSLNSYVSPIPLVSRSDVNNSFQGQTAVTSGWGKVSDSAQYITNDLRYVYLVIENQQVCKNYYIAGLVNDGVICANTARGTKSTCSGDSGGPLVFNGRQIGVTSFVPTNGCQVGGPAGFVRVTYYLDWIRQNTGLNV